MGLVRLLLECGADREVKSAHGKRAVDFATSFKHDEIEKLLDLGTSTGQRLLAKVTPERVVRIWTEPLALEPMARLRKDRQIAHAGGGMRPAGQLPEGEWLTVRSQAAVALAAGAVFVDEAEYNVDDGELSLDFKKVKR